MMQPHGADHQFSPAAAALRQLRHGPQERVRIHFGDNGFNALRQDQRSGNVPLNTAVSIGNEMLDGTSGSGTARGYSLPAAEDPADEVILKEETEQVLKELRMHLSALEQKVFDAYLRGMNYLEIAESLSRTPKSIDNALKRVKQKIRQQMKNE